uniref:Uncharacterized protein n=1 Tax=Romanomermis culicivorax TaxID=13658 RepID=A0A915JD23_ROMCU
MTRQEKNILRNIRRTEDEYKFLMSNELPPTEIPHRHRTNRRQSRELIRAPVRQQRRALCSRSNYRGGRTSNNGTAGAKKSSKVLEFGSAKNSHCLKQSVMPQLQLLEHIQLVYWKMSRWGGQEEEYTW